MNNLKLLGASYTSIPNSFINSEDILGCVIGALNTNFTCLNLHDNDASPHFILSTSISSPFNEIDSPVNSNVNYDLFINAYECASWGYALRHAQQCFPESKAIILSILDANLGGYSFWDQHPHWGKSGYGVCTLYIKLGNQKSLQVANQVSSNPMAEFSINLKRMSKRFGCKNIVLPFFPESTRDLSHKLFSGYTLFPDLHDEFGHCFGSDPWLSIIKNGTKGERYILGSLAFSGYWGVASVSVSVDAQLEFNTLSIMDISDVQKNNSSKVTCSKYYQFSRIYQISQHPTGFLPMLSLNLQQPLESDGDYSLASERGITGNILVNPILRYQLAGEVVSNSENIYYRLPGPNTIPMPDSLLSDKTLIIAGYSLNHILDKSIFNTLVIDRSFVPYLEDLGDNTFQICTDSMHVLSKIEKIITNHGWILNE
ncbi:MAG: hypothetical protein HWE18_10455 [Gammaproteobacteria bacterium]|nr:hypothetical protein [Gammaproteobacteria bacterium]